MAGTKAINLQVQQKIYTFKLDMAKLGSRRVVWDHEIEGSNPSIQTKEGK